MIRNLTTWTKKHLLAAAVASVALGAIPALSQAQHWDRRGDDQRGPSYSHRDRNDDTQDTGRGGVRIGIQLGGPSWERPPVIQERTTQVWVEPVYGTIAQRVWVEPEYRTATDRVWVEPVVQRIRQNVWVADRYVDQDVVQWDCGRRVVVRQRILVEPGHYEARDCDVVVAPGRYEDCARRILVREGYWTVVQQQQVVTPGHWETRVQRVAVEQRQDAGARIDLRIPIRW